MQDRPTNDEIKPASNNRRRALIAIAIVATLALMVILHLTGVVGAKTN
jgi:hypothetical protein